MSPPAARRPDRFGLQLPDRRLSPARPFSATPNFTEYRIYRIDLAGEPSLIEQVAGLHSVTGALEIVGDELWFADTTLGSSGLRVFEIAESASELAFSPLPVGLPPLGLAPLRLD